VGIDTCAPKGGINVVIKSQVKSLCANSRYDAFKHLRLSLFKKNGDLFAMLTAYFDDSGTSLDNEIAVVAGYIGSTKQWENFCLRWAGLLSEYKVTRLHRAELESYQGDFINWNEQLRIEFVKKAQRIIKDCTYCGVGIALVKSDFEEVLSKDIRASKFGMAGWCATGCLAAIWRWCEERNHREPIQFVFEAGTLGQGKVNSIFEVLYRNRDLPQNSLIGGWSFQSKNVLPLQAADTVAYEFYRFLKNELIDDPKRPLRLSAKGLFRPCDTKYFAHWDKERFVEFLKDW
jgi:hypothetical protein